MTGRERIACRIAGGSPDHLPLMPITMMFAADTAGIRYRDYASDARDFLVVPPGFEIVARYDAGVIAAERSSS